MKNKINNIKRFLTLLFTDRDIIDDSTESYEVKNDTPPPLSEPEWASVVPEVLLEDNEPDFYQVTPENVGPEKEEVTTKVVQEEKIVEELPISPSPEKPKKVIKKEEKIPEDKEKIIL